MLETKFRKILLAAFVLIILLATVDIIADVLEGTEILHVFVEVIVLAIAILSAFLIIKMLIAETQTSKHLVQQLQRDLEVNRQQSSEWKRQNHNLLAGLSSSINQQFETWGLTQTEKEIGLFLLKGFSHKEIAAMRSVSEATTRQQARAIYKKAGLSGRHDLAGFFLEDLALPVGEAKNKGSDTTLFDGS